MIIGNSTLSELLGMNFFVCVAQVWYKSVMLKSAHNLMNEFLIKNEADQKLCSTSVAGVGVEQHGTRRKPQ